MKAILTLASGYNSLCFYNVSAKGLPGWLVQKTYINTSGCECLLTTASFVTDKNGAYVLKLGILSATCSRFSEWFKQ